LSAREDGTFLFVRLDRGVYRYQVSFCPGDSLSDAVEWMIHAKRRSQRWD